MWALFLRPTLMPTWPGPQHGRHAPSSLLPLPHSANAPPHPATGLILATPTPTTPHGKINFLERRRSGHSPFAKPSTLDLGHYNHLLQGGVGGGRGHSHCRDGSPGFSQRPSPPLPIPPNHWQQPKKQFLQFPPTAHY